MKKSFKKKGGNPKFLKKKKKKNFGIEPFFFFKAVFIKYIYIYIYFNKKKICLHKKNVFYKCVFKKKKMFSKNFFEE